MPEQRIATATDREAPEGCRWFRLVTPRRDDHGTVILPEGGDLARHRANPLWLWMHSSGPRKSAPAIPAPHVAVGRVESYEQDRNRLDVLVRFDTADPVGQLVYRKTRDGFLRACSLGFDPAEGQPVERTPETEEQAEAWGVPMGTKVPVFERWSLLEGSSVILGSNEEALALLRAIPDREERASTGIGGVVPYEAAAGDDGPWDEKAERARWRDACGGPDWGSVDRRKYRRMFAYVLGDGPTEGDFLLPHHSVVDGKLRTNWLGVEAAISALPGGVPEGDVGAVRAHLERHAGERPKPERAAPAPAPTFGGNVSPPKEKKMAKMSPEHRWIARSIIGAHMATAEGHLRAMEHARADEHLSFHRDAAGGELDRAEKMANCMRAAAEGGDDDGDEMRKARRPTVRSAPEKAPADLRHRFDDLAEDLKLLDVVGADDVIRSAFGTDDPDSADAKIEALRGVQVKYRTLVGQVRANQEDAFSAERQAEVTRLMDERLMTPAQSERALKEKWSLQKLGEFRAAATEDGPVVEIVRTRPLRSLEERGAGGAGREGEGSVTPPAQERRPAQGRSAEVEQVVRSLGERTGLDPDKLLGRFEKWRNGGGKVGFDAGPDHV